METLAATRPPDDRIPLRCDHPGDDCLLESARPGRPGILDQFVADVNALLPDEDTPHSRRTRVLDAVSSVAERLDPSGCAGDENDYGRCVLHDDPAGWSLAAIALRPGQTIPPHDHAAWGGAVTVQGTERNRLFAGDEAGRLSLVAERDYPAGTGYVFDRVDVHEPVGADPAAVTVSLHFLVHPAHDRPHPDHAQAGKEDGLPDARQSLAVA